MKRILVTDAAGFIAAHLRATPRASHRQRLANANPLSDLAAHRELAQADVRDAASVDATAAGVYDSSANARAADERR